MNARTYHRTVATISMAAAVLTLAVLYSCGHARLGRSDDWSMHFGSSSRNALAPSHVKAPESWDLETGRNVKWTANLGSQSYASPVVVDGRVFVGTNNDGRRDSAPLGNRGCLYCFRESDGRFLWQTVHKMMPFGKISDLPEIGVSSTPIVESNRIYYVAPTGILVCADVEGFYDDENDGPFVDETLTGKTDGDIVWTFEFAKELGVNVHNQANSSPLIHKNLIYLVTGNGVDRTHVNVPNPRAPSFIAVDKRTGKLAWESNAPEDRILHGQWGSPVLGRAGGKTQVVFPGGDGWVYSFDPIDGELIWKFDGNPKDAKWELGGLGTRNSIVAVPVFVDGVVYVAMGQDPEHGPGPGKLWAIDASGQGDVTKTHALWGFEQGRSLSSPVIDRNFVFTCSLSGLLRCLDRKTGRKLWAHDLLAEVWSSPLVAGGKVYIGDEDGELCVVRASSQLKVLREEPFDNSIYSSPTIVNETLFLSIRTRLFAFGEKN